MLNVFSQPKSWRRHCNTGLERNSCMKFFFLMFPPIQNSGAAPVYSIYTVYLCCHLCPPPQFLYVADPMLYYIVTMFYISPYCMYIIYFVLIYGQIKSILHALSRGQKLKHLISIFIRV